METHADQQTLSDRPVHVADDVPVAASAAFCGVMFRPDGSAARSADTSHTEVVAADSAIRQAATSSPGFRSDA